MRGMGGCLVKVLTPIIMLIVAVMLVSFIVKKLWTYLVVRLFPGAVEQNLIAKDISWEIALIFAIIFIMITQSS